MTTLKTWLSGDDAASLSDLEAFYKHPTAARFQLRSKSERMEYLLNAPAACQRHQFLFVYVHSAVEHHSRRQAVRLTWGNVTRWSTPDAGVSLRFVLGRPGNDSDHQQRALVDEQARHGDLVQLDFIDTYHNMTLKAVGALQWINEYCLSTRSETRTQSRTENVGLDNQGLETNGLKTDEPSRMRRVSKQERSAVAEKKSVMPLCNYWSVRNVCSTAMAVNFHRL